jgi:5-methylcytosine-specific restriction endonuclease McrA
MREFREKTKATQTTKFTLTGEQAAEAWNSPRGREVTAAVYRRDGKTCANEFCQVQAKGIDVGYSIDHIEAKTERPDLMFDGDNLQVLCRVCNSSKGTKKNSVWMREQYAAYAAQ